MRTNTVKSSKRAALLTALLCVSADLGCKKQSASSEEGALSETAPPAASTSRPPSATEQAATERSASTVIQARANLKTSDASKLAGNATFSERSDGVHVVLRIDGAEPGERGVHLHETGDCSDIAGKSMGGHFAPDVEVHSLPHEADPGEHHLGDLGNIRIGENGSGQLELVVKRATLNPGAGTSVLGKALVVHSGKDQGKAHQPAGDSGVPIACGVIESSS